MATDYATPRYILRDAAQASGFALNTLRSYYGRGHFRIVGGEAKKGRGLAAELTLCDVMCIAVAKVAIDAGVNAAAAFEAGMKFAYSSTLPGRLPSQLFKHGITLLVCQPAIGASRIVESSVDQSLSDVFGDFDNLDPVAQVVIALNGVHARVIAALGAE